jgi:hypothetical protein
MAEIFVDNIGRQLTYNMAVYDLDGHEIGKIIKCDLRLGYFETEKGQWFPDDSYIPFSAIDHIDTSGVHLSVGKHYVKDTYGAPPIVEDNVKVEEPLQEPGGG